MNRVIKIVVDGKNYVSIPEFINGSCKKCVFNHNFLCLGGDAKKTCGENNAIYKLDVTDEKYTVDEVMDVYWNLDAKFDTYDDAISNIKKNLILKDDPEYQQFLKLKAKFENKDLK